MPGYTLVQESDLTSTKRNGIAAYAQEIGLLDFLRELSGDECPFAKFTELRVVGLEEVLHAARPDDGEMALEIHQRLRKAAQELERRVMNVQMVFKGKLVRGEELWVEYRGNRLPISHIFGSPPQLTDSNGNVFYRTNFNLTIG